MQIFKTSAFFYENEVVKKALNAPAVSLAEAKGLENRRRLSVIAVLKEVSSKL